MLRTLGLDESRVVAVLRPPATMSLYHRGISNELFGQVVDHLLAQDVQVVLLPRTPAQAKTFAAIKGIVIPEKPVDGPSLVYLADLVISAGGTMNREAALLGTPTWTTFAGTLGAVDRELVERGRMRVLERPDQLVLEKHTPEEPHFDAFADAVTAGDPARCSSASAGSRRPSVEVEQRSAWRSQEYSPRAAARQAAR